MSRIAAPRSVRRSAIVAAYVVVFWLLVPALLWTTAITLDRVLGLTAAPRGVGWPLIAAGVGLAAWAMLGLWRDGGGLPVSALPPPRLARQGPYRQVRHPIYLGFNVALFGTGLAAGSPALAWIVAPAFAPAWVAYARREERGLARRFGAEWRRYRARVGLLPRPGLYRLAQLLMTLRLIPTRVEGREHVPRRGPAILVNNHASYLDPAFVGVATRRPVHFLTTAEAYRGGVKGWLVRHFVNLPVRRYRPDPAACREMLRLLAEGELIGNAPEGERTPDGAYRGALPEVAGILARLPVPVIPVGISGSYDTGPRWSDVVRRRPVDVRVGPPVRWTGGSPGADIDAAIRALVRQDPQPVRLGGLPQEKLGRVLWRCPACGDEQDWTAAEMHCVACDGRYTPTAGGRFRDGEGRTLTLGDLAAAVRTHPETEPLCAAALGFRERSMFGPIRPLEAVGRGVLEIDSGALRFDGPGGALLRLALNTIRSVTTERADSVQVATAHGMWQFRLLEGSPFRFHAALDRWRAVATRPAREVAEA